MSESETKPGVNLFLEDVKIEGFKSFSQPTSMSFQPGIGVIVGNNGVGKSNILDAVVWALGETEETRLRCQERDELFFSGSKDAPPASRIRVELNFRYGPGKEAPSLRLSREAAKGGEDAFFVDAQPYEQNDYLGRLETLGLRSALDTIVRQEQINDVIGLAPPARYEWISGLRGCRNGEKAEVPVEEIGELFGRYLNLLMPQGEGRLQTLGDNDRKGVEIEIRLPGNRSRKAHQLSGGEKSVTSLALKLAVFNGLKSPFYLLDEVEPALDYSNHKSMQAVLKEVARVRQLIMITHLRTTIELANTLHGVRTRQDGSSFMKFYFVMDARLLRLYKCC